MHIPDHLWKRIAQVLFALLTVGLLYLTVWTRIQNGANAAAYLDACVRAGICPSADQIAAALQAKAPPAVKSNVPPPQPPTPAATPDPKAPVVPEKK